MVKYPKHNIFLYNIYRSCHSGFVSLRINRSYDSAKLIFSTMVGVSSKTRSAGIEKRKAV